MPEFSPNTDGKPWRYSAAIFAAACCVYYAGRAPFFGHWDSFDYLRQAVTHQLSALAFGRPVFAGFNIALWEAAHRLFSIRADQLDSVIIPAIVLAGAGGILLFHRFAGFIMPPQAARLAALGLLASPVYAFYSGCVMTEVPMLFLVVLSVAQLWQSGKSFPYLRTAGAGLLFGAAVGVREQAATLAVGFLWILWVRRPDAGSRLRAVALFGLTASLAIGVPIAGLFFADPAGFGERTRLWLSAIPMGSVHFRQNIQAVLLYAFIICPAAWLALGIGGWQRFRTRSTDRKPGPAVREAGMRHIPHGGWAVMGFILIPLLVLLRDADVQMHPRYLLAALPGSVIFCSCLFYRWLPEKRALTVWVALHLSLFVLSQAVIEPFREVQRERRHFAETAVLLIPDSALVIPGGLSPVCDYYRGINLKPNWNVLWSGWGWNKARVEAAVRRSWEMRQPVYLCTGPYGWIYLEEELLDVYAVLKDCPRERVAEGIERVYPPQ
jgi:4-amino-4-deoxy-L-arabinose transferase-like glycosyltransferase